MHKLILFPGAHKTGTTLLQYALEQNRQLMERNNIALLGRQPYYSSQLCDYLRTHSHKLKNSISLLEARKSLEELCKGDTDRDIVISIENIFGEFGHQPRMYHSVEPVISELQALLPQHETHVIYYVRRQDAFFESIFIQRVQKLHEQKFIDFYKKHQSNDLRWTPILDEIQNGIGPDNLTVKPFETIKSGVNDFIKEMFATISPILAEEAAVQNSSEANTNVSLSGKGLEMALNLFPLLDMHERKLLMAFLKTNFSNKKYAKANLLNDDQRKFIRDQFCQDNALLVDKYLGDSSVREFYLE